MIFTFNSLITVLKIIDKNNPKGYLGQWKRARFSRQCEVFSSQFFSMQKNKILLFIDFLIIKIEG